MADDGDYYDFYGYSQLNYDNTTTFGEHNIFPLHEHPNHPFMSTITANSVPPPPPPQPQPQPQESNTREPDQYVPAANMIRIMRKILPPEAKIAEDSKETIQECVTEFISFITGEANDRCRRELRKTITAEDLLKAMEKLGFNEYLEPLAIYLNRYRIQVERPGILQQQQQSENAVVHAENFPGFDLGFEQYGYRPMFTPKTLKEFLMSGPGQVGEVPNGFGYGLLGGRDMPKAYLGSEQVDAAASTSSFSDFPAFGSGFEFDDPLFQFNYPK